MADMKSIMAEIQQPLWHNWYITSEIGSGASGVVYRIEAKRGNRTDVSALKVEPITLDDVMYTDEQRRKEYLEKKRLAAVNETNIMYGLRKCPYIVGYEEEDIRQLKNTEGYVLLIRMEYLECLHTMAKQGKFNRAESNVLKLAHDIGSGIQAAHNNNVIHRDIKPANFFYSKEDDTYKLGDFNISKTSASARSFAGTEGYIAPEIYKAKQSVDNVYTKQADIYSFGICLYQLMNNFCFPFEEERLADEAIEIRMNGTPLPLPKTASPEFGRIILKACAYNPADRYSSIDEMLADINALRLYNAPSANHAPYNPASVSSDAVMAENPFSRHSANNNPSGISTDSGFTEQSQPEKKKSKAPVIIAVILTVIVITAGVIAGILLLKKNKDDKKDDTGSPEKAAEEYFESAFDADGYDTYMRLSMPDDLYDVFKDTDDYSDEEENHRDDAEIYEDLEINFTLDDVERGDELSGKTLNVAELSYGYMAEEYDVSLDINITEGYEMKITLSYEEDGESETESLTVCAFLIEGEGWKIYPDDASSLEF